MTSIKRKNDLFFCARARKRMNAAERRKSNDHFSSAKRMFARRYAPMPKAANMPRMIASPAVGDIRINVPVASFCLGSISACLHLGCVILIVPSPETNIS